LSKRLNESSSLLAQWLPYRQFILWTFISSEGYSGTAKIRLPRCGILFQTLDLQQFRRGTICAWLQPWLDEQEEILFTERWFPRTYFFNHNNVLFLMNLHSPSNNNNNNNDRLTAFDPGQPG